jgi:hypothetical protein
MFTEYEKQINNLVEKIKITQEKFRTDNGKYFQSLKTGNKSIEVIPEMAKKASDEKKEVPVIEVIDKIPFQIEIVEHQNTKDKLYGYTIVLTAELDGKIYQKSIGEGIGLTRDWTEIESKWL